ncbi:MAG: OmpA family protein [Chlorobi bacterium]|nr:OmpA family protein [Chlorobiota bacterium]
MKSCIVLIVALLFNSNLFSQIDFGNLSEEQIYRKGNKYNTWSVTVGFGPVIYYTDVIDYTIFPKSNWKFGPSIMISKQFNRPWGLDAQFITADMYGQKNLRYFEGSFMEATINLTFSINQFAAFGPIADKWDFYGKIGLGAVFFRSRQHALYDQDYYNDDGTVEHISKDDILRVKHVYDFVSYPQPEGWQDNDYLVIGYDRITDPEKKENRKAEIVLPVGFGVKYRLSKSFDFGVEIMMHSMAADNLDVNMTGADNDAYMYTSLNVTYKIGKKNKRHPVWTYKDFNIAYKQKREFDPLAQKLDSLKQQLDSLAANDSVKTDTTHIYTETIVYEEGVSASVFFDFDKYNITRRSHKELAKVARAMEKDTTIRIRIVGYCDTRGSDDYNYKLSLRRCNAVLDVLVHDYGISKNRFRIDPRGEKDLLSDTNKLRPRGLHMVNRRVDLFMIKE